MDAHFTWEGHEDELATGASPRVDIARAVRAFVEKMKPSVSCAILCGDFNDRYHPRRIFQEAKFTDTFSQIGLPINSTWPTPSWNWFEDPTGMSDNPCDFIFTCDRVRTLASQILHFSHLGMYPSDHFPIQAILEMPLAPTLAAAPSTPKPPATPLPASSP